MTLIDEGGTLNLRPHPGRDVNGWGSSWYAQPFLAGAVLKHTVIESVMAYSDRIHVTASGQVSRGVSSTYGTWNLSLDVSYNSAEKKITGAGTYGLTLAGELSGETGDLNLYKIASNYLDDVPLLTGGIGDTGDMVSVTATLDDTNTFVWTPPADHCPTLQSGELAVNVWGQYNNVDTAAMGYAPIEPAYKPDLTVVLSNTQPSSVGMTFCGLYDETKSQHFWEDNVGVHALILQGTTQTEFSYHLEFESQPLPDECSLPSTCLGPYSAPKP